jgi:hypothetical protein
VVSTDGSGGRLLTAGGVLSIAGGALQVFFGVVVMGLVIGFTIAGRMTYFPLPWMPAGRFQLLLMPTVGIVAVPVLVLGIVAIIGGVSALRKKNFGLSLAGAICTLPIVILGIPAIILVALSRKLFEGQQ